MTFYANAPPPLNRRASKLRPSDRLARPQSYNPITPQSKPASFSPNASPLPNPTHVQLHDQGYVPLPASLLPAGGSQPSQAQPPAPSSSPSLSPNRESTKSKADTLPPLPEDTLVPQRKPGHFPTILRPGGRPGLSTGRYGILSGNNGSMSDTPPIYA